MTRIVVDAALRAKLNNFAEPLELCDEETGRVIARIEPVADLSQFEPWEPAIDEEELRRREASNEWRTTAEVLSRLREPN